MKKHLNTIYVTTQNSYLHKDGETVVVKADDEIKLRLPIHTIKGIVCFGQVSCSPYLMGFCAENDVSISFLTDYGRFLAKVEGPVSGNVLLRRRQYRLADDQAFSAKMAQYFLAGKIANARTSFLRVMRDHPEKGVAGTLQSAATRLGSCMEKLKTVSDLEILRGIEGEAAQTYFTVFNELVFAQKDEFMFKDRNRRPPLDRVNCLLSFFYTLVMHDTRSALESVGLDPAVGFLHRDRPGRPSLALDLMEEFRVFLADRIVLSLINLKQITGSQFKRSESGAFTMNDEARKTVLTAYQERKQEEIVHPFLGEKVTVGLLFHLQALLLARFLRGDLDAYPPFVWR
ncbi:MAG: type I-C CRISPR-associated endonuclease Cas1 [Candidatus Omnitrophica bacterium]|nr:type I-C CRISPR-associated endonuclease Cas1 [Candidatus Omnitrophota bacterium]